MNIVFMGTPEFAKIILEELINSKYNVIGVVTKEDKPRGRGKSVQSTPVKELAIAHNIKTYEPSKIKGNSEFIDEMKSLLPDLFVVVAYGKILPKDILDIPKCGAINVHGSLLPKYRGAAPIQFALLNGEKVTGITTMFMDEGMDTGDMLLKKEVEVEDFDNAGTMHDKLAEAGAELLLETLDKLEEGTLQRTRQDDSEATYTRMIEKKDGLIDFSKTCDEVKWQVMAMTPWPSAYTYMKGNILKIFEVETSENVYNGRCGEVVDIVKGKGIVVKTGEGVIIIKKLQMQNSKPMDAMSFLNGNSVEIGMILGG